jgi:hypothetical protein
VKPFEKPSEPLCFQISQTFDYDYTAPPAPNNGVVLHVHVEALSLSKEELHALKCLSGPAYDPVSQMITLKPTDTIGCPPQDVCTAEENVNHLSKSFEKLIELARVRFYYFCLCIKESILINF